MRQGCACTEIAAAIVLLVANQYCEMRFALLARYNIYDGRTFLIFLGRQLPLLLLLQLIRLLIIRKIKNTD